jgi:exonuclease III
MVAVLAVFLLTSCGSTTKIISPNVNDSLGIEFGTPETFDIVTWNIENFPKHNPETSSLLKTIIPNLKVDCIAVQEVKYASEFNQLVSSIPGWSFCISGAGDTQTAIMYNTQTVQIDSIATIFTNNSNPFPRPPLLVKLRWNQTEIIVISLHLKAYGDNFIDENDSYDEERRRRYACQLIDQYITSYHNNSKVIVLGDMNDQIQEPPISNVFSSFISKPSEYLFTDMSIALNLNAQNYSYPKYSSHLDHILITNELFSPFYAANSYTKTILIENSIGGGWTNYYKFLSDHRPVGSRFKFVAKH